MSDLSKTALRQEIRAREAALSPEERSRSDCAIMGQLLRYDAYLRAKTVFCFVGGKREIDTAPLLRDALARGKTLCVPRCRTKGSMDCVPISSLDALLPAAYGILEPPAHLPALAQDAIDFIVVPCLSCDLCGRRLGHGGGYYDRFLRDFHGEAVLLCRKALLLPAVPCEAHDISLARVMTEEGVFCCAACPPPANDCAGNP